MGVIDIGALRGVLELKDDFTSKLDLASIVSEKFGKDTLKSFTAITEAGAIVAATFGAIALATVEMGKRGSDVNDVAETLDHFAGSSKNAKDILDNLRTGTKNTVDDFLLMKDAAHLLSTNVNLSATDFKTLGDAAFVMKSRGLGPAKEQLDLVSDALVTGKTKALAHALGVVEITNAQEAYAKSLNVTVPQLSKLGVAEANRIAVMSMLSAAVKDAGEKERTFGDQILAAQTFVTNYTDEISKAIDKSPAFAAAFKVIGDATINAFGGDQTKAVDTVVGGIKEAAIIATDFGLAAIETARVFNVAWSTIKVAVLGTEAAVAGTLAMLPGATDYMRGFAASLGEQVAEAAKGVTGNSAFDGVLDKLSGTIMNVRDALENNNATMDENDKRVDIAKANAQKLSDLNKKLTADSVNRQKVEDDLWKIQEKSLIETSALWEQFFAIRTKNSGTSLDAEKAAINAWRNDEIQKLDASDKNWKEHYNAINAVADEKMRGISSFFKDYSSRSVESLEQTAQQWENTYNEMIASGKHFSREVWDEVIAKMKAARQAATEYGASLAAAQQQGQAATEKTTQSLLDQIDAEKKLSEAVNARLGYKTDVNYGNFKDQLRGVMGYYDNMGKFVEGNTGTVAVDSENGRTSTNIAVEEAAKRGYSFSEIVAALRGHNLGPHPGGPKIPGFIGGLPAGVWPGGLANMNEAGPETVYLPPGAGVIPHGALPGGGSSINIHPGAFQFMYPIMNDRKSLDHIMRVFNKALDQRLRNNGQRTNTIL